MKKKIKEWINKFRKVIVILIPIVIIYMFFFNRTWQSPSVTNVWIFEKFILICIGGLARTIGVIISLAMLYIIPLQLFNWLSWRKKKDDESGFEEDIDSNIDITSDTLHINVISAVFTGTIIVAIFFRSIGIDHGAKQALIISNQIINEKLDSAKQSYPNDCDQAWNEAKTSLNNIINDPTECSEDDNWRNDCFEVIRDPRLGSLF